MVELFWLLAVGTPGSEPTYRESHCGPEAPGALQVAKQETQSWAFRSLFQALTGKTILQVNGNARLQFEMFKDTRMPKGFGRSSEVRW